MSNPNPAQMADAPFYSQEYGEFLSSKAARLAEVLHDYNPYLELVFIPSSKRDDTDTLAANTYEPGVYGWEAA